MSEAAPTPAKICTSCGAVGATRKCVGCGNTRYCDKTCQQRHWKAGHRGICVGRKTKTKTKKNKKAGKEDIIPSATKYEQAAAERACASGGGRIGGGGGRIPTPSAPEHEEAASERACASGGDRIGGGGGHGHREQQQNDNTGSKIYVLGNNAAGDATIPREITADFSDGGGSSRSSGVAGACSGGGGSDDENLCPICMDNEEEAIVEGQDGAFCSACGQLFCGACNISICSTQAVSDTCPMCRAPICVSPETDFRRLWRLIHDRPSGRHTALALFQIGYKYSYGRGVKQDCTEAIKWYRQAAECEGAFARARYNLANIYKEGRGVKQDLIEAAKWYRSVLRESRASEGGVVLVAMYNLGALYCLGGPGFKQDYNEAAKLVSCAARKGLPEAQLLLGNLHFDGHGVKQDRLGAIKLFKKAAGQGLQGIPECKLGLTFIQGVGVLQDYAEALKWFQLGAEQGHAVAIELLGRMQQTGVIPTPPPGTAVIVVCLTSATGKQLNNKAGTVTAARVGVDTVRPGRVLVTLEGGSKTLKSFKLMNLRMIT